MYQFGGLIFRQGFGGPIGLRLTSMVARIVMDKWAKDFLQRTQDAGMRLHLFAKYVDDVNVVMGMLRLGMRWQGKSLVYSEEMEEKDREAGLTREDVTMERVRELADDVIDWLDFTQDHPGKHSTGMVPILDVQVWISHPEDDRLEDDLASDTLCWIFYEKPVASQKLLRANSAYTWRSKLTTMAMEMFCRYRNSMRQLTMRARLDIQELFIDKLRTSGYSQYTVKGSNRVRHNILL